MKILQNITTVFDENLIRLVRENLEERVRRGEILWEDAYQLLLDESVNKISKEITLTQQDRTGKIDRKTINRELTLAKIYLVALELESKNIDRVLGTHELIRKDDVRTITDIRRRYLDIVNHSEVEFKTRNVEIRDGKIRLFPIISQSFVVKDIETTYAPTSFVKRLGNDPTPENISPGTDSGFWETVLLTKGKAPASATMIIDFVDTISFNRLRFNGAGKFPITITNVEVLQGDTFVSIHTGNITNKFINIIYPEVKQTSKIRLTVEQTIGDFLWWTFVDNKRDLIQDETSETAEDNSIRESIKRNKYIPVVVDRIDNVPAFQLGAFNILFFLDIFSGDDPGTFFSRKFTSDDPIDTIRLSDEIIETKPGSSRITYNIIQQDGSRISINPGDDIIITKTFETSQNLTNGIENQVTLLSAPLNDSTLDVKVNGEAATLVTEFTGTGALEFLVTGRKLYFSVGVSGKTVSATYNHRTDFVIIEIILNNGTTENQFDTPSVENFGVIINGSD